MRQEDIAISREMGVMFARPTVRLVMEGGSFSSFKLGGILHDQIEELNLQVFCNDVAIGDILVKEKIFSTMLMVEPGSRDHMLRKKGPSVMRDYNKIELRVASNSLGGTLGGLESLYGVSFVTLQ